MGPLTLAMLIGVIAGLIAGGITALRRSREQKRQQRTDDELYEREQQRLLDLTIQHFEPLKASWERSVYTDEYGTRHYDKWEKELRRFFESVGYKSETYTPSKVAMLMGEFIEEHSNELDEKITELTN